MTISHLLDIPALSQSIRPEIEACLDGKAKPPKSLGRLEELAVHIGLMQQCSRPKINDPVLIVFAGDHGLTRSGVAAFPASVTVSMVDSLLTGRASANAIAKVVGASVHVVDAGVADDLTNRDSLIHRKVGRGTNDASVEPAMSLQQAQLALNYGGQVAGEFIDKGADIIALGEMGIGNSSSAALIIHRLSGESLDRCIGPGAGHSDEGMANKRAVLARAADRSNATAPMDVLVEFGGFEIGQIAGAILECAKRRVPVLIDGFICSSAALLAIRLAPQAQDFCIFTHTSAEPGYKAITDALNVRPLLDLDMCLGEGTGALLTVPIIKSACAITTDVATLAEVLGAV